MITIKSPALVSLPVQGDFVATQSANPLVEEVALEELTADGHGSGLEAESTEHSKGLTFDPSKIDVITQARTVDLLMSRLREGELDLSPEFQRRANIWDVERKSSLIESLLLRIPIPSLYVSEDHDGNYTVVDGLQRMCTVAHFVDVAALNKAVKDTLGPLRLRGLQSLTEQENKSYEELPRPLKRRITETEFTLHVIRPNTPDEVKFNIFSRINQGGLPLTAQEIRNAIFRGDWRKKVSELAENEAFKKATERKIKGERMEDLELVLRFVALYTLDRERTDNEDLDEFLNNTVKERSKSWGDERWKEIEESFYRALAAAPRVFGPHAFRKYSGSDKNRRPINRGLFEAETVVLSRCSPVELKKLEMRSAKVLEALGERMNSDQEFSRAITHATGRGWASNTRLKAVTQVLRIVLDA